MITALCNVTGHDNSVAVNQRAQSVAAALVNYLLIVYLAAESACAESS